MIRVYQFRRLRSETGGLISVEHAEDHEIGTDETWDVNALELAAEYELPLPAVHQMLFESFPAVYEGRPRRPNAQM